DLHHPEVSLAEYPANAAEADGLMDAGEDEGRVDELHARVAGVSDDVIGESADQPKARQTDSEGGER
ncbi:MAG: hypothetical protein L0H41_12315, partial [Microlunatus sp.]|nr:hypothetical protein [Microlunatus sp.]MDN5770974.1 hypothetical protein [Microlunatus sp.]